MEFQAYVSKRRVLAGPVLMVDGLLGLLAIGLPVEGNVAKVLEARELLATVGVPMVGDMMVIEPDAAPYFLSAPAFAERFEVAPAPAPAPVVELVPAA